MKTFLFWLPRLLAILMAVSLSVFAFDVFSMPAPIWKRIGGFVIHTIPSILILTIVIISWKRSFWGTALFTLLFIGFTIVFHTYTNTMRFLILSLPVLIIALFYTSHYFYSKQDIENPPQ